MYIKKGGKGLKNASFWAINSNFFDAPPCRRRRKLICRGKKLISKQGVGKKIYQNAQYISLLFYATGTATADLFCLGEIRLCCAAGDFERFMHN